VKPRGRPIIALLALGCGWACSSEPAVPPPTAKRPAVGPPPAAQEASSGIDVASYSYDPTNKRDPFKSFIRGLYGEGEEDSTSPLERFDLSQLELSAIIWGIDAPRALITDPSGKGYVVSTGAVLGKNKGRIVSIGDNSVVVKETYVDSLDRATTKPVEMHLRTTEGG
jgi:type IV pilus assembly protein PilP